MTRKLLLGLLMVILALGTAGCGSGPIVVVEAPTASVDTEIDKSKYIITPDVSKPNNVPIDEDLSYVDTAYLMNLMKINGPTSSERTSYGQYPSDWTFVLVDSRPAVRFTESHINGAINIPDAQFEELAWMLPEDKNKMLIFYCGGLDCHLSPSSAHKAKELGYTNVHVYQEGITFWKEAGNYLATTAEYVATLIGAERVNYRDKKPYLILDNRPYNVYFNSHIPTALSMDDKIFIEKYIAAMPVDKSAEIITYCGGFF